jgi:ABC-type amino acid transport substrate-binding protein
MRAPVAKFEGPEARTIGRESLRDAIDATIEALRASGEFAALVARLFH